MHGLGAGMAADAIARCAGIAEATGFNRRLRYRRAIRQGRGRGLVINDLGIGLVCWATIIASDLVVHDFEGLLLDELRAAHVGLAGRLQPVGRARHIGGEQPQQPVGGQRLGPHRRRFGDIDRQLLEQATPIGRRACR